uniref:Uncharacterized protein n=1 Tax=Siphoviridae sp. ctN5F10 TaxID=2825465 RepID=A0A8S5UES8_9CAUD|nr:MAG TPA: hypothetical protein [Siphoviridae sp. ctN5F10]
MIRCGRLYEFICEVVAIKNEETEEQTLWELWLHKDFAQSYTEFRESLEPDSTAEASGEDLASIIQQSREILNFVPPGEL